MAGGVYIYNEHYFKLCMAARGGSHIHDIITVLQGLIWTCCTKKGHEEDTSSVMYPLDQSTAISSTMEKENDDIRRKPINKI